jgi:hypothetical protein
MLKIEARKVIEFGPPMTVVLPRADFDKLTAMSDFSGLARGEIIKNVLVDAIEFYLTKTPDLAAFVKAWRPKAKQEQKAAVGK